MGRRQGQTGSITVVQRFGSALNLNLPHSKRRGHALVLDGVYTEDRVTGRVRWHRSLTDRRSQPPTEAANLISGWCTVSRSALR